MEKTDKAQVPIPAASESEQSIKFITTKDIKLHTLCTTWKIPNVLPVLRTCETDLAKVYRNDHHRRIHTSPVFHFNQEIKTGCFTKVKLSWVMNLCLVKHWNGKNYIALAVGRTWNTGVDSTKQGMMGLSWGAQNIQVPCHVELEIVNADGQSIFKREAAHRFPPDVSRGIIWPCFATHSQVLTNNPGNDLLIRCTIRTGEIKLPDFLISLCSNPVSQTPLVAVLTNLPPQAQSPPTDSTPHAPQLNTEARDTGAGDAMIGIEETPVTPSAGVAVSKPNNAKIRVIKAIKRLQEEFPDFHEIPFKKLKISCQDQEMVVPPLPLAARSIKFRETIAHLKQHHQNSEKGSEYPSITLEDVIPTLLQQVLEYLIKDTCFILEDGDVQNKMYLLQYAIDFRIDDLTQILLDQLLDPVTLTTPTVATALQIAVTFAQWGLLCDKSKKPYKILGNFVIEHRNEIKETADFRENPDGWRLFFIQFLM